MQILIFTIEDRKFALNLNVVERSILAVECSSIPNNPEYVLGVINVHGKIIPVVNIRKLLGIPSKELATTDRMILCKLQHQRIALLVDHVERVEICENFTADSSSIQCILNEEITFLCDLEKLIPEHLILTN